MTPFVKELLEMRLETRNGEEIYHIYQKKLLFTFLANQDTLMLELI